MRNSRVRSLKHCFEDQRSHQDHKKFVQERHGGNRFVIREIPIHRSFNGGQGANGSGDLSGFSKGKNFSSGANAMDYDVPEFVVFIQEDPQQLVKDICIDRAVSPLGKNLSEDCELNHNVVCLVDHKKSNLGTVGTMSSTLYSKGSEYAFQHPSIKDAISKYEMDGMEKCDCKNLMMKGEVQFDSGNKISTDHPTKRTSQTLREAFRKDAEFSRSFKNWQINSYLATSGSRVEFPHSAMYAQFTNTTSMPRPEIWNSQSITGSSEGQIDYSEEIWSCALGPPSGLTSCTGLEAASSSAFHHQSNDSISSAHSFAFPILPEEWSGSPVKMMEADKSQSRRHLWQTTWCTWWKCC